MLFPISRLTAAITLSTLFIISPLNADIIHVDDSAPAGGNGSSWALAFNSFQDALDAASAFDEIRVAQGTYRPSIRVDPTDPRSVAFVMIADVVIYGGYAGYGAPDPDERDIAAFNTILSGDLNGDDGPDFTNRTDNCYHVVFNDGNILSATAILDGFTISGGHADMAFHYNQGGGIFIMSSSPTLNECTFTDNWAVNSAGVSIVFSSSALNRCTIVDNRAGNIGGGIIVSSSTATLTECIVSGNTANLGGGMSNLSSPTVLTGCVFSHNVGLNDGGGMHNLDSSPILTDCAFIQNSGGGMLNDISTEPYLNRCTFVGNTAQFSGGGIANLSSSPILVNCIFQGNSTEGSGGGIFSSFSAPQMINCTFTANMALEDGGALANFSSSSPILTNCILWADTSGNPPSSDEIFNDGSSMPDVSYCDVEGGYAGTGNIDVDPLFVDSANYDYHLTWESPCRNTGDNSAVTESEDFEGDPRIAGSTVDMGADEYWYHLYLTGDPVPGGTVTFKVVGIPDMNPVNVYRGSLRPTPLSTQYGLLFIKAPFPHIWDVGPVPANGIASTSKTIPNTVSPGDEFYFQALHGPLNGASTKLTNLLTLTIE